MATNQGDFADVTVMVEQHDFQIACLMCENALISQHAMNLRMYYETRKGLYDKYSVAAIGAETFDGGNCPPEMHVLDDLNCWHPCWPKRSHVFPYLTWNFKRHTNQAFCSFRANTNAF